MTLSLTAVAVNPNGAALAALQRFMMDRDYSGRCRCDAASTVRRTGCVADCVPECLEPYDLAGAEQAYVDALPVVHASDPSWNDRGVWLSLEDIQAAGRRVPRSAAIFPPALTDAELAAFWPNGGDS